MGDKLAVALFQEIHVRYVDDLTGAKRPVLLYYGRPRQGIVAVVLSQGLGVLLRAIAILADGGKGLACPYLVLFLDKANNGRLVRRRRRCRRLGPGDNWRRGLRCALRRRVHW